MDRRDFLRQGFGLAGGVLIGCSDRKGDAAAHAGAQPDVRGFLDEGRAPMHIAIGEGLQGRRFTDLSILRPEDEALPASRFFVRTRAPAGLSAKFPWSLRIGGMVRDPFDLPLAELLPLSRPQGVITMECAGNDPGGRFGLLSTARWEGIPLRDLFAKVSERTGMPPESYRILVRGMDDRSLDPRGGEGASWNFAPEELGDAFLATAMDGKPLSPDHGYPIRLVVPGWYGCACIKWVTGLEWTSGDAPSTAHMRDYAGRTHQSGIPEHAGDFRPARMELSALPVRLEKWRKDGRILWRLVGITWGGDRAGEEVQIQSGDLDWREVEVLRRRESAFGWTLWSYLWRPRQPGIYTVTLRPKDPATRSLRLKERYYARDCHIDEVTA